MTFVHSSGLWAFTFVIACQTVTASEPFGIRETTIESYDSAIQLDPNNSTLYAERGAAQAQKNEPDFALADFARAIELDPDNPLPYRYRAKFWSNQRETNNALRDFDEAIRLDPDHAATYAQRGLNLALKHRWDESFADFDKALERDPNNPELFFERSLLSNAKGDRRAAIEDLETVIHLNPDHSLAYAFRGWQWFMVGNFSQSVEDYSDVLRLDPRNCNAHLQRALARMRQREFAKALSDITIADELDPRSVNPQDITYVALELLSAANLKLADRQSDSSDDVREAAAYRDRGIAHRSLEHWNDALKDLNEAIRQDQSSSMAFAVRGRLWLHEREWDRAIEDFDAALQLNPRDASVWRDRGTAHAEKGEWAAACDDFTQAIQIDSLDFRAIAKRGAAWQAQGKLDLAIADYEQVIHGTPFYVHVPRSLWQNERPVSESNESSSSKIDSTLDDEQPLLGSKGGFGLDEPRGIDFTKDDSNYNDGSQVQTFESSSSNFGKPTQITGAWHAVCLDPDYLIALVNHAKCMVNQADWEQAIRDYQELTRLAPTDPQAFRHIAWLKATCPDSRIRNGEQAVQSGRQAIERGHSSEDHVALSAAYAEQGDFTSAIESLSRAREIAADQMEKELQTRRQRYKAAEFERIVEDEDKHSSRDETKGIEAAVGDCDRSQWKEARAIEILAEIYAAAGQFDDAIACCEKHHELMAEEQDKPLRDLLELYTAGRPYRTDHDALVKGFVTGSITPKLELFSDEKIVGVDVCGLPVNKLTVAQIRLLSFHPKQGRPDHSARHADSETEMESVESKDQLSNSERNRKANEASHLVARGLNRQRQGEFEQALKDFQEAIQLDSQNAAAFNSIARLQATCSNVQFRNGKEALQNALTACELTDWKAWNLLDTLAAAYAETGDFPLAIQWTEASIELVPFDEPESETERLQKNLEQFRLSKAIRE